jgi:hypothetical protein
MSSAWEEAYDEASGRAYYFNRLYAYPIFVVQAVSAAPHSSCPSQHRRYVVDAAG